MATALDEYKRYYGLRHDGETVLRHAYCAHFRDSVTNDVLTADKLKDLGITAEMSRGQIIDCLSGQPGTIDKENKSVVQIYRYSLQQVIDFCSEKFDFINDNKPVEPEAIQKTPFTERLFSKLIDPILDAVGRRLYMGSFKKKKPNDDL